MPRGAQAISQLQRTMGNRAVGRLLSDALVAQRPPVRLTATGRNLLPIQRARIENPSKQTVSEDPGGWSSTAHHIVPYSKLEGALKSPEEGGLSVEHRAEVLRAAIPTKLTRSMADNLKIKIPEDEDEQEFLARLRDRLDSDESGEATVSNIKLADIRESFFLWQGGNQFEGPNTSTRSEPGEKEDIDFDAEFFHNLPEGAYAKLIEEAREFVRPGQEEGARVESLKKILAITKDVTPKKPDWSKDEGWGPGWHEVTSREEVEELAKNEKLGRQHILQYTHFKVPISELGEGKKYPDITPASGDFMYKDGDSSVKAPVLVRGMFGYINYNASQEARYTPVQKATKTKLKEVLDGLNVTVTASGDGKNYVITTPHEKLKVTDKNFTVVGYTEPVTYKKTQTRGELEIATGLGNKLLTQEAGALPAKKSLFTYCTEKAMPVSTWLPQQLYERVTAPEKVPEQVPEPEKVPEQVPEQVQAPVQPPVRAPSSSGGHASPWLPNLPALLGLGGIGLQGIPGLSLLTPFGRRPPRETPHYMGW